MKQVYVFHGDRDHKTGQYNNVSLVARMNVDPSVHTEPEQALEHAYRYTNNVNGSWSLKMGHDAHPDVTVLSSPHINNGRFMGLRSTMVGDLMAISDDHGHLSWYEVEGIGFTAFDPTDMSHTFERLTGSFLKNVTLPSVDESLKAFGAPASARLAQAAVYFGVKDANMCEQAEIKPAFEALLSRLQSQDGGSTIEQADASLDLFAAGFKGASHSAPGFNQAWLDQQSASVADALKALTGATADTLADTAYEALVRSVVLQPQSTEPVQSEPAPAAINDLLQTLLTADCHITALNGCLHFEDGSQVFVQDLIDSLNGVRISAEADDPLALTPSNPPGMSSIFN